MKIKNEEIKPDSYRRSRPEVFCKEGALRNFAKFTEKHQCQSLFFNKVAGLGPATLLKKKLWHWCFPVNFAKFLRTPFFTEHLRWLLLFIANLRKTYGSWIAFCCFSFITKLINLFLFLWNILLYYFVLFKSYYFSKKNSLVYPLATKLLKNICSWKQILKNLSACIYRQLKYH